MNVVMISRACVPTSFVQDLVLSVMQNKDSVYFRFHTIIMCRMEWNLFCHTPDEHVDPTVYFSKKKKKKSNNGKICKYTQKYIY